MIFTYDRQSGLVSSFSEGRNTVPKKFEQVELSITDSERDMLTKGYRIYIKNGRLTYEGTGQSKAEQKQATQENVKAALMSKGDKITVKELKDLILQIL